MTTTYVTKVTSRLYVSTYSVVKAPAAAPILLIVFRTPQDVARMFVGKDSVLKIQVLTTSAHRKRNMTRRRRIVITEFRQKRTRMEDTRTVQVV